MKHLIIYHDPCLDGICAATIVWDKLLNDGVPESDIVLHPAVYGLDVPKVDADTKVYIVDFSYPWIAMESLCSASAGVTWIDHHKSAIEAFDAWRPTGRAFPESLLICRDNTKSGALLAWEWAHPGKPALPAVEAVSIRDTWQKDSNGEFFGKWTEAITAYGFTLPFTVQDMHSFVFIPESEIDYIATIGNTLTRKHKQDCEQLVKQVVFGHRVAWLNCNYMFASECGNMLCQMYDIDFAACYSIVGDEVRYSLRSVGEFDVSAIAKRHGGGGHRNAAGCTIVGAAMLPIADIHHSLRN